MGIARSKWVFAVHSPFRQINNKQYETQNEEEIMK